MELDDMSKLLQSHDKTSIDEELPEMESTYIYIYIYIYIYMYLSEVKFRACDDELEVSYQRKGEIKDDSCVFRVRHFGELQHH